MGADDMSEHLLDEAVDKNAAMAELKRRWHQLFTTLYEGGEAPPAQRLRTEGMMETLCLLGVAREETLLAAMSECYQSVYGESLAQRWGDDWASLFPFPQLPAFGQRAPVFPSTHEDGG